MGLFKRKNLLLIFNPIAGQGLFAPNLFEVVDLFTKAGFWVTTYPTQAMGEAKQMIMSYAESFDYLVCSGGDGTLNEAIDALMFCIKRPVFGYIPAGTTNDFASSLGLPKDILQAARVITQGAPKALDIGKFQNEYFSYVAAFGLFTDVSYGTPQSKKNILGHLAYLLEGVKRLGSIQSYHCTFVLDEQSFSGEFIFAMVTNSLSVGGFQFPSEGGIHMDDGFFEVALLQMPKNFFDLQNVIASIINQETYSDSLILRRARSVTVYSEIPLAWTLDGEYGGEYTEVTITNQHKAIEIMMPPL